MTEHENNIVEALMDIAIAARNKSQEDLPDEILRQVLAKAYESGYQYGVAAAHRKVMAVEEWER